MKSPQNLRKPEAGSGTHAGSGAGTKERKIVLKISIILRNMHCKFEKKDRKKFFRARARVRARSLFSLSSLLGIMSPNLIGYGKKI